MASGGGNSLWPGIKYVIDDNQLKASKFLGLAQKNRPGNYNERFAQDALNQQSI